jgi:folate-binding protein YgfZ
VTEKESWGSSSGIARLTDLGVIRVEGLDAAKFVHAQLTQDFALLATNQARLAAFCSAKGRMLASFVGLRHGDAILLLCRQDILATTLQRLARFVLRAKVQLSDATAQFDVYGLVGAAIMQSDDKAGSVWSKFDFDGASVINIYPSMGLARQLWVAARGQAVAPIATLLLPVWQWLEVRSGVATISNAIIEAFVPQMLNYESLGGVNFKKGCYPGQEVVARSQFRGTLKRRAALVHCNLALEPGDEVFEPERADQAIGTVVQASASPQGGFDAIISATVEALKANNLRLRTSEGEALSQLPLPYPLLEDI